MRTDVLGKAVRAQGGAVVKPHQVKAMILAARRAYVEQAKLGSSTTGSGSTPGGGRRSTMSWAPPRRLRSGPSRSATTWR